MKETVTLITERKRLFSSRAPLLGHVVVGLERESGLKMAMNPDEPRFPQLPDARKYRIPWTIGTQAVDRLVDFYQRSFVDLEDMDYDCNGLGPYLAGKEPDMVRKTRFQNKYAIYPNTFLDDDMGLEEGACYAIALLGGDTRHSIIGANIPTHSVSTMGRSVEGGGLLVFAANDSLVSTYNGFGITPVYEMNREHLVV